MAVDNVDKAAGLNIFALSVNQTSHTYWLPSHVSKYNLAHGHGSVWSNNLYTTFSVYTFTTRLTLHQVKQTSSPNKKGGEACSSVVGSSVPVTTCLLYTATLCFVFFPYVPRTYLNTQSECCSAPWCWCTWPQPLQCGQSRRSCPLAIQLWSINRF